MTLHAEGRGLLRAILFLPPFSPVSLWLGMTFPSLERPEEMVPQGQGGSLARVHTIHTEPLLRGLPQVSPKQPVTVHLVFSFGFLFFTLQKTLFKNMVSWKKNKLQPFSTSQKLREEDSE